jgi:NADH:ubiquinone oxidoreductase subunit B-like Fe-S oxidoreductase
MGYCQERVLHQEYLIIYSVLQGMIKYSSSFVPGCPRPEQIVDGVMKLQELVRTESVRRRSLRISRVITLIISNKMALENSYSR